MCKTKMAADAAEPTLASRSSRTTRTSQSPRSRNRRSTTPSAHASSSTSDPSTSNVTSADHASGSSYRESWRTSVSSRTSLTSLRDSLPESPHIYDFSEIRSATNNFLAKRYSSSSAASWRCSLRGKDVVLFQRKFRRSIETAQLREILSVICRSHHMSIIKLLGVSISGAYIYLAYDFVNGASLADCLRNSRNPDFTVLSSWISRMQIATDLAHGLDYIHNNTGLNINLVHNHIKSSSVIVVEPSFNAKICHFGTALLCGEVTAAQLPPPTSQSSSEITEISEEASSASELSKLVRSDSRGGQFEGTRGYMSPELLSSGVSTQKSDVYAFGVVILELLSGEEPLKFKFDKTQRTFTRTSVIETARAAIEGSDNAGGGEGREGRLRRWVDRRLKDSFPVEVAEKVTRIALECVHADPDKRPNMQRVAGKISKRFLESRIWLDSVRAPTDISVSLAPR